jgi:hypothetical protein
MQDNSQIVPDNGTVSVPTSVTQGKNTGDYVTYLGQTYVVGPNGTTTVATAPDDPFSSEALSVVAAGKSGNQTLYQDTLDAQISAIENGSATYAQVRRLGANSPTVQAAVSNMTPSNLDDLWSSDPKGKMVVVNYNGQNILVQYNKGITVHEGGGSETYIAVTDLSGKEINIPRH